MAPPFELPIAHRWFAEEFNNAAWDLVEATGRSPDDDEQMIHMAHAACAHWQRVGTIVNQLRAQCLLATAYAAAGLGEAARRHAEKCLGQFPETAGQTTPFDRACAHGAAANAYACAGDLVRAREHHRQAVEAAAHFDHLDEKPLFERLYPLPSPRCEASRGR